tara:strand:+ start:86 stop:1612 length:1527 start_codon:yes stop_codon:yes gene_type:complete
MSIRPQNTSGNPDRRKTRLGAVLRAGIEHHREMPTLVGLDVRSGAGTQCHYDSPVPPKWSDSVADVGVGWLVPVDPGALVPLRPTPAAPPNSIPSTFWETFEQRKWFEPRFQDVLPKDYREEDTNGNIKVYEVVEGESVLRRVEMNPKTEGSMGGVFEYTGRAGSEVANTWSSVDGTEGILFAEEDEKLLEAELRVSTLTMIRDRLPAEQLFITQQMEKNLAVHVGEAGVQLYKGMGIDAPFRDLQIDAIMSRAVDYRSKVEQAIYKMWKADGSDDGVLGPLARSKYRNLLDEVMRKTVIQYDGTQTDGAKVITFKSPSNMQGLDLRSDPGMSTEVWQAYRKRVGGITGAMDWADDSLFTDTLNEFKRFNPLSFGYYLLKSIVTILGSTLVVGMTLALAGRAWSQSKRNKARKATASKRDAARATADQQRITNQQTANADLQQSIRDKRAALEVVRTRLATLQGLKVNPRTRDIAEREEPRKQYEEQQLVDRIQALEAQARQRGVPVP